MCTYNGEAFLAEQLTSFEQQTYRNWTLHVSDDGSQDETLELLQAFNIERGIGPLQILKVLGEASLPTFFR